MTDMIGQVKVNKRGGQWHLSISGLPGWLLEDIYKTAQDQIWPGVLVHTGSTYECDLSETTEIHFCTWGGGAFGSPRPDNERRYIHLKKKH